MPETIELLKNLTEAHGIPGYEAPVRALVRELMDGLGELSQDKLGSVICKKVGESEAPKVMLAGHMDEIGLMVKHITKDGYLKFLQLGGWFDQVAVTSFHWRRPAWTRRSASSVPSLSHPSWMTLRYNFFRFLLLGQFNRALSAHCMEDK